MARPGGGGSPPAPPNASRFGRPHSAGHSPLTDGRSARGIAGPDTRRPTYLGAGWWRLRPGWVLRWGRRCLSCTRAVEIFECLEP